MNERYEAVGDVAGDAPGPGGGAGGGEGQHRAGPGYDAEQTFPQLPGRVSEEEQGRFVEALRRLAAVP